MERAIHGIEAPVYHFSQIIGRQRLNNDRPLMFPLRNREPDRFDADGAPAASGDQQQV